MTSPDSRGRKLGRSPDAVGEVRAYHRDIIDHGPGGTGDAMHRPEAFAEELRPILRELVCWLNNG